MITVTQIQKMLNHSKQKLAEWQEKLNNAPEYSRQLEMAKDKVYRYKYEVINLKKAIFKFN